MIQFLRKLGGDDIPSDTEVISKRLWKTKFMLVGPRYRLPKECLQNGPSLHDFVWKLLGKARKMCDGFKNSCHTFGAFLHVL